MHYKVPFLTKLSANHDVDVFGLFGKSHWKKSKLQSVPSVPGINYEVLFTLDAYVPYRKRYAHFFWTPSLRSRLEKISPDVVITGPSNFPNNLAVIKYCTQNRVPYLWHGIGSMSSKQTFSRKIISRQVRRLISNSHGGLAYNSSAKDYYVNHYGADADRIWVASNVVDTDKVNADRERFRASIDAKRSELGLNDCLTVLFVGAIDPVKKLDVLISCFARIRKKLSIPIKLLIVGDGVIRQQMEAYCNELEISDSVVFAGKHVADVNQYFMLGDVFVMPGLGGLAISHAMSHGIPVISAPADGTERDLIKHGDSGYLLSPNADEEEICGYLEQILLDDSLRKTMGDCAKKRIDDQFNINRTVHVFYEAICSATGRPNTQSDL